MKVLLAVALIMLGVPCWVFCQTASEPIPAKWLHGGHLVVPEFNFSMDSPNPDSKWSYRELPDIEGIKATAFIVDASAENNYMVVVWERGGRMDSASTKSFINGMQKSLPKDWQIGDVHIEPTAVPMSDSAKFKVTLHLPSDSTLYTYGYAAFGKRTYMFFNYSSEPNEPLQFSRFVASFALLSPSANAAPPNPSNAIMMILGIVGAVLDWKYKRRGGVKPTKKARLYFLLAAVFCLAFLTFLGLRGASAESLGTLCGLLFIWLFALWELARWLVRRKNPLPPAMRVLPGLKE
jgi:hypothetical protein